MNDMIHFVCEY